MDWKELGLAVAADMLPIIMALATAAGIWALRLVAKRFNIKLSVEHEEAITKLLRRGIAAAEEAGSRKLGIDGSKMPSETKSKMVYAMVKKAFPDLEEHDIIMRMDAEIARMDGVGATKRAVGSEGMNDPAPVGGYASAKIIAEPASEAGEPGLAAWKAEPRTEESVRSEAEFLEKVRDKSGDGPND